MVARIMLVTFQQALRSVVLSLLPITTLTLVGWALAGSQSANTSDPLRASIWIWLATHLIPFELKLAPAYLPTLFNYLPLAASLLPIIILRSSFNRANSELNNPRAARSFLTIWYALLATFAALALQSDTVKPIVYLAPIYSGVLTLISTVNFSSEFLKNFKFLGYTLLLYLGIAILLIFVSLIVHFSVVRSLALVVSPGLVGGLLFLIIQLLYLPNLAVAVISYIFGIGFEIGSQTLVTPFIHKLNGIPAIPVLAALPNDTNPWLALLGIPLVVLIALNIIKVTRKTTNLREILIETWKRSWIFIPITLFVSYQSGGTLISNTLNPFGVNWWSLPTILLGNLLFVLLFIVLLPAGAKRLLNRS